MRNIMDKRAIKNFAIEARNTLMSGVISKLSKLGITELGIEEVKRLDSGLIEIKSSKERYSDKDVVNREKLVNELRRREEETDFKIAYYTLVEEVSYTWFNRLIAIRFMEVNNYLPERLRVLSSETPGKKEPDIITTLLETALYQELDETAKSRVTELLMAGSAEAVDQLYQLVFIRVCNRLNKQLPDLFEKIDDYTELLFTISYIDENGVIASLLTIPEEDFNVDEGGQVEIIGWMYQYYNTELKDKVFARGNRKIRSDEIPAATQLFTPEWIVRYMVENSLGRYYIDQKLANPLETRTEKEIADSFGWKYYLPTAEQPEDVQLQIADERKEKSVFSLQELKLIDPSMGSGHVLVYAFDVFIQLYEAEGESPRNAVEFILQKNLYGLDIDKRAFQLAYFALMMKGRQSNRRILTKNIKLNIYAICDNFGISEAELQLSHLTFPDNEKGQDDLLTLAKGFKNARDLGSLIEFIEIDFENLKVGLEVDPISFVDIAIHKMVSVGEMLQQKYDVGVTNPPYMGSAGMNKELSTFVKKYYPDSKSDLFSVFIERLHSMIQPTGYTALITQHAWMFLSSFEKLRIKINQQTIINMIHLGTRAFEEIGGEVVQTTAFVLSPNKKDNHFGNYLRLVDFPDHQLKELKVLEAISNEQVDYFYQTVQDNYSKIPGIPISYWVSETISSLFTILPLLQEIAAPKSGLATGNNNLFQKRWFEINFKTIGFGYYSTVQTKDGIHKWFPENSGGEYRKWYPANEYVVNWKDNGESIKTYRNEKGKLGARAQNTQFYFKEGVTWNKLSSSKFGVRFKESGFIFDDTSRSLFANDTEDTIFLTGYLCSVIVFNLLKILNPTMSFTNNDLARIPVDMSLSNNSSINGKIKSNIELVKKFDSEFEEFWSFKRHPLI